MPGRMRRLLRISLPFLAFLTLVCSPPAGAAPLEKRFALVIGNASYKAKALATPVNDAALIAQTLQASGFDVMGARDLDGDLMRQTFRDFVDCVAKAGPDTVVVVYFAGYGLQFEGENYLVPIDSDLVDASDVPIRALRLSDQTQALAALQVKTALIILDAARAGPFVLSGQPPAGGLAWVEPETNMLIAFNAAPGTVATEGGQGYGPYARALAEMIREGGLMPASLFDRVRLRVNELTKGAQVPWDSTKIGTQFMFFERGPGAPARADSPELTAWMRSGPMRSLTANDAYMVALMRDTLDAYADCLADFWHDPMTKRIGALLAARREAITWRRTYQANVPDAYWSYLERYPRGPHVADARRLLTHLGAAMAPPAKFKIMEYDVPPPLPDEFRYVERTALAFDDPAFAFEPAQPPPVYFLESPPPELQALAPPLAPVGAYVLPTPVFVPLPAYVSVPAVVAVPRNPPNLDDAREALVNNSSGRPSKPERQAVGPRLPPSVALKAMLIDSRLLPPGASDPVPPETVQLPQSRPLPTVALTPLQPTDDVTPASSSIEPPSVATHGEPPIADRAMSTATPTAMPLGDRRTAMLSARAVGRVPLPRPRPAMRPLPITPSGSRQIAHVAATSSIEVRRGAPSTGSSRGILARPTHFLPAPKAAPGVSPPNPRKKQCLVVNGRPSCN